MQTNIYDLVKALHNAKVREDAAKADRLALEEQLATGIGLNDAQEGSKTFDVHEFKVTYSHKLNVKIDGDMLCAIAKEKGLTKDAGNMFRWKPEINKKNWDAANDDIKTAFAPAITKTPSKVSFTIKLKEDK